MYRESGIAGSTGLGTGDVGSSFFSSLGFGGSGSGGGGGL
jgi:hypothetical protein